MRWELWNINFKSAIWKVEVLKIKWRKIIKDTKMTISNFVTTGWKEIKKQVANEVERFVPILSTKFHKKSFTLQTRRSLRSNSVISTKFNGLDLLRSVSTSCQPDESPSVTPKKHYLFLTFVGYTEVILLRGYSFIFEFDRDKWSFFGFVSVCHMFIC